MLVLASIIRPEFHVDAFVLGSLLVTGCALVGIDLKLWGGAK